MTTQPPITVPAAQSYSDQAEQALDGSCVSRDTRAITYALLYVGAAIEAASRRHTDDVDAIGALLDDRLTSIEAVVDPAIIVPRVPLRARLAALVRPARGWHDADGGYR